MSRGILHLYDETTELHSEMVRMLSEQAPETGIYETVIEGLTVDRCDEPKICEPCIDAPALACVVQGSKMVQLGDQDELYGPLDYAACNVHLPVSGRYVDVSGDRPFLGFKIALNTGELSDLLLEATVKRVPADRHENCLEGICGLGKARMDHGMQLALVRLLSLLASPADIPVLAPLARREIFYRALNSELGARIRKFSVADSQAHRVSQVISMLQIRYNQPLRIGDLASEANMSESSLYHTFKKVTRMSPLQFQKRLRLQQARRLMLAEGMDAASASFRVGYESPSQFSREYSRMYGAPPREDVSKLRGASERVEL